MVDKTISSMNNDEFDALVEQFIERGEDKIAPQTFLQVMAGVAEQHKQHEVEVIVRVVNGEIVLDTLSPLPVDKNALYVGDTKVTLKLQTESNA